MIVLSLSFIYACGYHSSSSFGFDFEYLHIPEIYIHTHKCVYKCKKCNATVRIFIIKLLSYHVFSVIIKYFFYFSYTLCEFYLN